MVNNRSVSVSNRDLYDAIDGLRKEFGGAIQRLDDKFTTLEAGRLTRAEGNISDMRIEMQRMINQFDTKLDAVKATGGTLTAKATIIGTILIIVLSSLSAAAFYRWLVK